MFFGFGLIVVLTAFIGFAVLAGHICHIGELERDPLDPHDVSRP